MQNTALTVLFGLSFCHLLNDMMQSLLPALYPILKTRYDLDFGQIGLITLAFQITASLLQPLVGMATDKKPRHYSLAVGMGFTLVGILMLANADSFALLLIAAAMIGTGSSIFHPEASRVARLASGGRHGFAQSVFQVGGNAGSAIGPLIAAFVILPLGQSGAAWFALAALLGIILLFSIGNWYRAQHPPQARKRTAHTGEALPRAKVQKTIAILLTLIFSKQFYLASISSFYTFYLMDRFALSIRDAQLSLFLFLGAVAVGTIAGGPIGDRIGRRQVIWVSILGILPFTLVLPYANLFWTLALSVPIGLVLASAFPAILVYAQELLPGRVGMVAGLFFGFAFGMAGIGAGALGALADATSIEFVYRVCSFLPMIGLLAVFLPNIERARAR
ncbi:MFS transporter [Alphaproteobacteria bacterium LMG 31809]|uniref:MFS transporter n=1 Tax=Govanella unica TaxID=2975056 RepID=A0A9X3TY72_9PROT|nr:MFS transporter [Govania unica]